MTDYKQRAIEVINELGLLDTSTGCQKDIDTVLEALTQAHREGMTEAVKIATEWTKSDCHSHDNNPCCHVRTATSITQAITQRAKEL